MAYKGPQEVVGPSSATDETLPRFDTTEGDIIQGSGVTVDDSNVMGGVTQLNVDNLRLDGNTLISTDTNGDINLTPDGSGSVVISDIDVAAGEIDGTAIGANSASTGAFTAVVVDNLTIDGNTITSTDTNGDIVLTADGTGTISVTTAPIVPTGDRADSLGSATLSWDNVYCDGVTFDDGTNVLGNYVTSTAWTPVLEFGGGVVGITYDEQVATYMRIGNMVFLNVSLDLSSKGSSTGNATITGFPFTSLGNQAGSMGNWSQVDMLTNKTHMCALFNGATATISIQQSGDGTNVGNVTDVQFSDASKCKFSMAVVV